MNRFMRLLFAHDHPFSRDSSGRFYSSGPFPTGAWGRYLRHFDGVLVVGRDGGTAVDPPHLTLSSRPGLEFELFPNISSPRQLFFPSPDLDARMASAVRRVDAVVARLPSEIGYLALKYADRMDKPYAVEVVGCAWSSYRAHGTLGGRIYAPLAYLRARRAIASAPLALYVTSSWLQAQYPNAGHWRSASNVSIQTMGRSGKSSRKERLRQLAEGRRPILGTIGSLQNKYKGVQTAIEALARLRRSDLDLTYRVLGPGAIEPWQRLASQFGVIDLVHFDGTRSAGEGVRAWLDRIDLYLQPSFTEGIPKGTVEAMSRGAVCIGSTCGGIPELLPPERLHGPGDAARLASIVGELAANPQAMATASRADLERSRQFEPEILDARRNEIFAELRACAEARLQSPSRMAWSC